MDVDQAVSFQMELSLVFNAEVLVFHHQSDGAMSFVV
jgi:hypothetical protein